ncbi:MAG: DUF421 domain-containing protein [Oscillospiraceae bacterium]|jgi:uncharacterized membrane protein YcaP (DUF421 family)|nr:DUF421 domain-containing protein [Oscillospiraceae bacterium]
MLTIFFRTVILYIIVVFVVRLMGKRQIGQLGPTELVITILISNIATLPLEDHDIPLMLGVIPILTLACLDIFMSYITMKSKKIRQVVEGHPKIIIRDGKPNEQVMSELRFSLDELLTSVRAKDIQNIKDVQLAIVETNGTVSVFEKPQSQNQQQNQQQNQKPKKGDKK